MALYETILNNNSIQDKNLALSGEKTSQTISTDPMIVQYTSSLDLPSDYEQYDYLLLWVIKSSQSYWGAVISDNDNVILMKPADIVDGTMYRNLISYNNGATDGATWSFRWSKNNLKITFIETAYKTGASNGRLVVHGLKVS